MRDVFIALSERMDPDASRTADGKQWQTPPSQAQLAELNGDPAYDRHRQGRNLALGILMVVATGVVAAASFDMAGSAPPPTPAVQVEHP